MPNHLTYINPTAEIAAGLDSQNFINRFLSDLDISPKSRKTYRESLESFFRWIKAGEVGASGYISRNDILAYKKYLDINYSVYTANLRLTTVRLLYSWLESNMISPDITRGIKGFKKNNKSFAKDALTKDQIIKLTAKTGDSLEEARNHAIVTLMAYTGVRSIEVERADIDSLRNINGKTVLYIQGKGRSSADDYVVLAPMLAEILGQWLALKSEAEKKRGKTPAKAMFISTSKNRFRQRLKAKSIQKMVKDRMAKCGIAGSKITCHSLRHSAGSMGAEVGDILEVQTLLRHSNPMTSAIYVHQKERTSDECIEYKIAKYLTM